MAKETNSDLNDEPTGGSDPEELIRGVGEEGDEFEDTDDLDDDDLDDEEEEEDSTI